MVTVKEVLDQCRVQGNNVYLPEGQLDRKIYEGVKKALEGIGGKWKGGKISAFVFQVNPSDRLAQIQGGEKLNLKKDFQFFETPDDIADRVVSIAFSLYEGKDAPATVLEPSAGQGALIKAWLRAFPTAGTQIYACEPMPENKISLEKQGIPVLKDDFLELQNMKFDIIIANPPFTKNQDIEHYMHMWECLRANGVVVSVVSTHWHESGNRKESEFRTFLHSIDADVSSIDAGAFKSSGTNVPTCIVAAIKK